MKLADIGLVFTLLLAAAGAKWLFSPGLGMHSLDGDYYFQIARNVEQGRGLTSNVSLYNQGYDHFPHRIHQSPVWPLVLGSVAHVVPLSSAAELLPELLYVLDLWLLWLLLTRLQARLSEPHPPGAAALRTSHLCVLLFGLNPIFFRFTSLPYTEAWAFACWLACMLLFERCTAESDGFPKSLGAAMAGGVAALTFLSRTQFIGLPLAVAACFALAALNDRKWLALSAWSLAGSALVLLPWYAYLASWLEPLHWQHLVGAGRAGEVPGLSAFSSRAASDGSLQGLYELLRGTVLVAFNPWDFNSYVRSFGWAALLVPLTVAHLLWRRNELPSLLGALATPRLLPFGLLSLGTALLLAPVHLFHGGWFRQWLFAWRHGLPLIVFIALSIMYLRRQPPRLLRALLVVCVAGSLFSEARTVVAIVGTDRRSEPEAAQRQLVAWLAEHAEKPIVVTTRAQPLSVESEVFFHWTTCRQPADNTRALLAAGADYVLVYPGETDCSFVAPLREELRAVHRFSGEEGPIVALAPKPNAH